MAPIIRPTPGDNNRRQLCRWHEFAAANSLESEAAEQILQSARQAIQQRGAFHVVLAGGTTPTRVYEQLRHSAADWPHWHIYFGDERCLPPSHPERNSHMAALSWLKHVSIPASQIHIIPAERGAEAAAGDYAHLLQSIAEFDLILLGLGEDGHTASLFPGHDWGAAPDAPAALAVHDAPKPPPDRVSLSAQRLSRTRQLMFLVSGSAKKTAVQAWRDGINIPAAAIAPACGVDIFLEQDLLGS